jgi:hypothetical protein
LVNKKKVDNIKMHGRTVRKKLFVSLTPTYFALHMTIPKEVEPDADVIWRMQLFNKSSNQGKEATDCSRNWEKTCYSTRYINHSEKLL